MTRLFQKYRRIAKSISPMDISSSFSQEDLSWDDLFAPTSPTNTTELFLGKYSKEGINFIMDRFGLTKKARRLGIRNLTVHIDTKDPYRHILTITNDSKIDRGHILMEFVARYQNLIPNQLDSEFGYANPLRVLTVEWLLLQNPTIPFSEGRPRLPGQEHPGLGLGDELMALFAIMGRNLRVDGIINVPEYYHTGLLFGKHFIYLSPYVQAQSRQIAQDLWKKYRLSVIAWASTTGSIFQKESGEVFRWQPRKQIIPIQSQLRQYFKSDQYLQISQAVSDELIYAIDEDKLRVALEKMDEPPFKL